MSVPMLTLWILMLPVGIDVALGYGMQRNQPTTLHSRVKREAQVETQVITIPNTIRAENVMIGLIKDFARMQNTSRITACLPIPKAAGDPISWGIITSKLPEIPDNKTIACRQVSESRQVVKNLESNRRVDKAIEVTGLSFKSWKSTTNHRVVG